MARPLLAAAATTIVAFAFIALACDGGGDDPPSADSTATTADTGVIGACSPAREHAAGESREALQFQGAERAYLLHVPGAYDGETPAAVVLALHGLGSSAEAMRDMTGLAPDADERGMITVFPAGTGTTPGWNMDAFTEGPDDAAFLQAIVAALREDLCVDESRVYATGYSNGGGMALRLACDTEGIVAAVAPVAAPFPPCQGDAPIIAFHGSADPVVPYEGGASPGTTSSLPPVHRAASEWARGIGCEGLPAISRASQDVETSTYPNCLGGDGDALLHTVINGGHTWPGAAIDLDPALAGTTTHTVSANELMLDFFDAH